MIERGLTGRMSNITINLRYKKRAKYEEPSFTLYFGKYTVDTLRRYGTGWPF